jgi:hypothetical protein
LKYGIGIGFALKSLVGAYMQKKIISRHKYLLAAIGIFALAFAVFGWGIQYKISLYNLPGSVPNSIPQAKLLSQRERLAPSKDVEPSRPSAPQPQSKILFSTLFLATIVLSLRSETSVMMSTITDDGSREQQCAHSNFFSFRPPPAQLPSI